MESGHPRQHETDHEEALFFDRFVGPRPPVVDPIYTCCDLPYVLLKIACHRAFRNAIDGRSESPGFAIISTFMV